MSGVLSAIKLGIQHKSTYLKSVSITWAACDDCVERKHMQIILHTLRSKCMEYLRYDVVQPAKEPHIKSTGVRKINAGSAYPYMASSTI